MKVYCLLENAHYEGSALLGVFVSVEAALRYAKKEWPKLKFNKCNIAYVSSCSNMSIEEYEVKD